MEGKAEKNYRLYLINKMKLRCLAKGKIGRHETKTKGWGGVGWGGVGGSIMYRRNCQ